MCHGFGEGDERQTSALNCLEDGEKEGYSGQGKRVILCGKITHLVLFPDSVITVQPLKVSGLNVDCELCLKFQHKITELEE